jgi:hypothetical protein
VFLAAVVVLNGRIINRERGMACYTLKLKRRANDVLDADAPGAADRLPANADATFRLR